MQKSVHEPCKFPPAPDPSGDFSTGNQAMVAYVGVVTQYSEYCQRLAYEAL